MNRNIVKGLANACMIFVGGAIVGSLIESYRFRNYLDPRIVMRDLIISAVREDDKYAELKEYAEIESNVYKGMLNNGDITPAKYYEQFISSAILNTVDAVKHANARDALFAFYNTAPYFGVCCESEKLGTRSKTAIEFEDDFALDLPFEHRYELLKPNERKAKK